MRSSKYCRIYCIIYIFLFHSCDENLRNSHFFSSSNIVILTTLLRNRLSEKCDVSIQIIPHYLLKHQRVGWKYEHRKLMRLLCWYLCPIGGEAHKKLNIQFVVNHWPFISLSSVRCWGIRNGCVPWRQERVHYLASQRHFGLVSAYRMSNFNWNLNRNQSSTIWCN